MSGLITKVTAVLLVNIMVVQGKTYQEDRYRTDGHHVERYHSIYSDNDSSDSIDNVKSSPNSNIWKGLKNGFSSGFNYDNAESGWFTKGTGDNNWIDEDYYPVIRYPGLGGSGLNFGKGIPDWFPKPAGDNNGIDEDYYPVIRYPGRGGSGLNFGKGIPDWFPKPAGDNNGIKYPGRGGRGEICKHIKGLPSPESGCCGMQLKKFPEQQYPNIPTWSPGNNRFRRSPSTIPNKMIRGGKATDLHQLPWMVRLSINPYIPDFGIPKSCGGTIISSRYVITAAHCLYNTFKDIKQLEVFLAEYNTTSYPKDCVGKKCIRNIVMKVEHVILHPKYNDKYMQNDVALMRLSTEIPYTGLIRPICLPTMDVQELSDKAFIIAGWGLNGKIESDVKQAAIVSYVSDDQCKAQHSYKDDSMFCSIGGNGEDICHGDSGGPLMVYHRRIFFLSGVVNGKRGDEECGSSVPSLFNNVFYHRNWIASHVK